MGRMYFPGEKIRERLPKRKSDGDIVARFGAWMTDVGAIIIAYICCAFVAVCTLIGLIIQVIRYFQDSIFSGFLSIFVAFIFGYLTYMALYFLFLVVFGTAWVLGWVCYNKWTFFVGLILVALWYFAKYQAF